MCCSHPARCVVAGILLLAWGLAGGAQAAEVALAWDASTAPGVTGYKIYYGIAPGSYTAVRDVGKVTTATVSGLADGTTYYFAAGAYGTSSSSGYSNQVAYTTPPAAPGSGTTVSYRIWDGMTPATASNSDASPVELGMKFRSSAAGTVTGIRFYKGTGNTGRHVGNLWSREGRRLATIDFANETASGWQEARFSAPVAIAANTTYVVSYHTDAGHYAINTNYFTSSGRDAGPLRALGNGEDGGNGVYRYGSASAFPNSTWNSSNYWVDVVFETAAAANPPPATAGESRLWDGSAAPAVASNSDTRAVELGLKFRSATPGTVTGVRFYKGPANTGQHVGNLWTRDGRRLASVVFANETASGWQEARFSTPVTITANTTYVVSYHTAVGRYAINTSYFATSGRTSGSLYAPAGSEAGGNGVYRYGSTSAFPTATYSSSNYWVDVVFQPAQDQVAAASATALSAPAGTVAATSALPSSAEEGAILTQPLSAAAVVPDAPETAAAAPSPAPSSGDAARADAGLKPDAPTPLGPTADEVVALEPLFRTDGFHSADPGAVHAETRWQVFREDDHACVLDVRSRTALTRFIPPRLAMEGDTAYTWRAQVVDHAGRVSEWSEMAAFATEAEPGPADTEPPTDLDRNGVRDDRQPGLKVLTVEGTDVRAAVAAVDPESSPEVEAVASERLGIPGPFGSAGSPQMALGLIHARISVNRPGGDASVHVYFPGPLPRGSAWYEADLAGGSLRASVGARLSPDRRSVVFPVSDGGPGDADGTVNGVIVTASGPGLATAADAGGNPDAAAAPQMP